MRLLARSWNVYHGRTHPESAALHLERMVRLVTADAPDVVALQEVPLWAVRRLERWSGMQVFWAVTLPARLGPLARRMTDRDPVRYRATLTGQANALLVNPHFEVGRHRLVVLNPGFSRVDWLVGRAERRVCHALEVDVEGQRLVVANLHASNDPDENVVAPQIERAAAFLAGAERVVLAGDFNIRRYAVDGYTAPIEGIDQILARGLEVERGPEAWPEGRRRFGDAVLSDHAPVEAVIASTS
jgi:endonuclease/exonuclease/phosphatase family metal-dependent hydrolase